MSATVTSVVDMGPQTHLVKDDDLASPAKTSSQADQLPLPLTQTLSASADLGLESQLVSAGGGCPVRRARRGRRRQETGRGHRVEKDGVGVLVEGVEVLAQGALEQGGVLRDLYTRRSGDASVDHSLFSTRYRRRGTNYGDLLPQSV